MPRLLAAPLLCSLALTACAPPYQPYCRVVEERSLNDAFAAQLQRRPDGQITELSITPHGMGVGSAAARAQTWSSEGVLTDDYSVGLSSQAGLILGGGAVVAVPQGVVEAYRSTQTQPGPDGGTVQVTTPRAELHLRDGGLVTTPLPGWPVSAWAIGDTAVLRLTDAPLSSEGSLVSLAPTGSLQGLPYRLLPGDVVSAGPDSLALLTGPRVLSADLQLLAAPTADSLCAPFGAMSWSLERRRASCTNGDSIDLLLQRVDLDDRQAPVTSRVTGDATAVAAAEGADGTGLLFTAGQALDDGGWSTELWFAFVDAQGHKRGPDVRVSDDSALVAVLTSHGNRFAVFSLSPGLRYAQVLCE